MWMASSLSALSARRPKPMPAMFVWIVQRTCHTDTGQWARLVENWARLMPHGQVDWTGLMDIWKSALLESIDWEFGPYGFKIRKRF